MAFHDRRHELEFLDELYARPGGQLLVVYGRRRVGKTVLLTHWLVQHGHPALFWTADRTSSGTQVRSFSHAIQRFLNPEQPVQPEFTYGSWELALLEVARLTADARLVVVVDEFTYLIEAEPSLTNVLQRIWDHRLKLGNVLMILTGSHAGMIEREVLAYRSPLYNRATGALHLQPLAFGVLSAFLPDYDADDRAKLYACVGGVPQYLELLDPHRPADWNIRRLLRSAMIIDDAGALLRDQLGEPRNYAAVVEAIAAGFTRSSEIATMAGLQQSNVAKYLGVLQHLGIVARQVPATVKRPERSKQGRYRIVDHYLRFYYRFIAPARTNLERGLIEQTWQTIGQHLPAFVGAYVFEELCQEWVLRRGDMGQLPFVPRRVGSFWGARMPQTRGERSRTIDVLAINEDEHAILLGECKWLAEPVRRGVVTDFLTRAQKAIPAPTERWNVTYAFFSRSGFTEEAKAAAVDQQCLWISLEQLDDDLAESE